MRPTQGWKAASLAVASLFLTAAAGVAQQGPTLPFPNEDKLLPAPTPLVQQDKPKASDAPSDDRKSTDAPVGAGMEQYQIQLTLPDPARLFRADSERMLQERIRREARTRTREERVEFPKEPVVSTDPYQPRAFPPMTEWVEPYYVCYGRLYFEDKNAERYGWDLGFVQPLVSLAYFYYDVALLPYHMGTEPCRKFECSAGQCLPGDPVPYLIYPPQLSLTGAFLEAATIVSLFAIFPG